MSSAAKLKEPDNYRAEPSGTSVKIKFRYWQARVDHTRTIFIDTPKNRAEFIKKGAMFFSTPALSEGYDDTDPDKEIIRYDDFIWDFDNEKNPEKGLVDLRHVIQHLGEIYEIDPYCLKIYCSGKKGFHLVIPAECFGSQNGDVYLPKIYKRIACQIVESLELTTADLSIYNMKSGKPFRIPNVRRSNGRYKVPLTLDEVQGLSVGDLWHLADSPREVEAVESDTSCPNLAALYQECKAVVHKEIQEEKDRPPVDPEHIKQLNGQLAPCIIYILRGNPKTDKTTFNLLTMDIVKYFQGTGFSLDGSLHLADKFLQSYPHSTQYTTYHARLKHFREQWRYHEGHGNNFSCSYILGLGFPGSAFDCKKCPLKCNGSWGQPEPLNNSIPDAPPFPQDCLPDAVRNFVKDTADRMQVQFESVAMIVLATTAGCIGKHALIFPRAKDNWKERICLWVCLILPPGMKKSPMIEASTMPLKILQAEYAKLYVQELDDWNKAFSAAKQQHKAWEIYCRKALKNNPKAELSDDPMLLLPHKPLPKRTYTSDCTIEKMVDIMNRSPGLTQISDELAGFLLNMNRYSSGSDRQFYLKCKTGGGHSVDRVGRGEEFVDDLYLNIIGGIQPKVAKTLFEPKEGAADDGFLERFGLMVYPAPMTSYSHIDRYPDRAARDAYYQVCQKLAGTCWADVLDTDEHHKGKGIARFDDQAQEAFNLWDVKHGRMMLSLSEDESINTMLSKAPGLLVQLAFLFHLVDWADGFCMENPAKVTIRAFERAERLLEYLVPMWKRILAAFADDGGDSGARKIAKWLIQEKIKVFTVRDIKQKHWSNLKTDDEIEVSIFLLIGKKWIREAGIKKTVGRPAREYVVNPAICDTA